MILHGNQRGGGNDLALHLMKDENERVQVHELRGFVSDTLIGAFKESYAISKATRCKQHLYSLSINPPKEADIADKDFVDAVEQVEKKLGLVGQPRAIVFHEKRSDDGQLRRHAHAVWCRINTDDMKAVQLSHDRPKLRDVSRDLHIQHDLKMPRGLINSKDKDPRNFSLEEWQQCKRAKKDVHQVKDIFKDCWAISDSRSSFAHALAEQGYILAQGNRGHVAVDYRGEKYAVSRYVGIKAKDVRSKLGDTDRLPSVDEGQQLATKQITDRLKVLRDDQQQQLRARDEVSKRQREQLKTQQASDADRLKSEHEKRSKAEEEFRNKRLRKGMLGLFDRFSGRRKRTVLLNERERSTSHVRDRIEVETLLEFHRQAFIEEQKRAASVQRPFKEAVKELDGDIQSLSIPPPNPTPNRDRSDYMVKEKFNASRQKRPRRFQHRSISKPSREAPHRER